MSNNEFAELCKQIVVDYFNSHVDKSDNKVITSDDVYIVWICKILQNNKALVSTNICDGMYYEITYNGKDKEVYVAVYKNWENYNVAYMVKGND